MHDLKYRALVAAHLPDWGHHLGNLSCECLRGIAEGLNWYLVRLSTFSILPAWIALETMREQLWTDYARVNVASKINPDLLQNWESDISDEVAQEFKRLALEHRTRPKDEATKMLYDIGVGYIENRLSVKEHQAVPAGIEILLSSIVKDSWTAFETTAKELFAVLLDNDNGTLLPRALATLKRQKPGKGVTPTFNLKTHPGSYYVQARMVEFGRLDEIEGIYKMILPGSDRFFETLEGGYIKVLSAFRNVLSHNRGKADQTFCRVITEFREFSFKEGDEVRLDGETVSTMRNAAIALSRKLIEEADKELANQKKIIT